MKEHYIRDHRFLLKAAVMASLLTLVACSTTQGPVVIRESSAPVSSEPQTTEKKEVNVQPVSPDQKKTTLPLVEKLVGQANAELSRKKYDKAINLAERGLRVDRKEPRLYLILSKAYRGEHNNQQSVHFAKQGLRYADKTEAIYQELKSLSR